MKTLNEQISDVIQHEPVAVFMKGTPQMVMCGNSHRALQALHAAGSPITTVDVLPDPLIPQELSSNPGWATRPEVIYTSETDRSNDRPRTLRTHVIPLGVELHRFARGTRVLDGHLVGNVARLAEQKGQRDLIAAAPKVLERHPNVRFVVAGDGELREELEILAAPLGDRFSLLGPRGDVPDVADDVLRQFGHAAGGHGGSLGGAFRVRRRGRGGGGALWFALTFYGGPLGVVEVAR